MENLEKLLNLTESYNPGSKEVVKKAYELAKKLHDGQFRQSGEPYITHPLSVAYILAEMHADADTLCAALLHDTIEDTNITKEEIAYEFNADVANLVDGVTKLAKMNFSTKEEESYVNTRKIVTSITNDVRIIIIKLADRLHNMRTLEYKTEFKQKENALETIEIFVPLAYYIGAYRIKSELEDLSLKYSYPDKYKEIEEKKLKIESDNRKSLDSMYDVIKHVLDEEKINNEIKIRTKNIYGIYQKLEAGYKLSNIHDLLALKIMVDTIEDCYKTLYLVHREYHPINGKFKDYICNPKTNMYQSLHTTVFGPEERLIQTQIRTFDMDKVASFGLTSYWNINKGNARESMQRDLKEKFQFFASLQDLNNMSLNNEEFVSQVKSELFGSKVYVYTSNGIVLELPKGSTIVDYAYKLGPNIGNTMLYALVNGKKVEDSYELKNKDRVRIITDDLSYGTRKEWLDIAKTSYARKRIREFNNKK